MADQKTNLQKDAIQKYIIENSEIKSALGETIITTTKDRVENCLLKYLKLLEKKNNWVTPLSIILVVVTTLLTTEFKDYIVPKSTWQAIYIIAAIITLIWLLISLRDSKNGMSLEKLLEEIQKGSLDKKSENDDSGTESNISDSADKNPLLVLEARYETDKNHFDGTEKLNSLIVDNKLKTTASNSVFPDPEEGVRKKLSIKYSYNGEIKTKTFDEDDIVELP
ncbi:MAG: hypothetical protein WC693_04045 [Patescibacteria group bacterium]